MAIDKKLAEKVQRERYVMLETGVSEGKKGENGYQRYGREHCKDVGQF